MKDRIVTTITGLKVKRSECQRIKGAFYKRGNPKIKDSGECYLVEGKHHRFNNGYIEYDHYKKEYVLIHKNALRFGIVDFNESGELVEGYFVPCISENVQLNINNKYMLCLSESVAKKGNFREKYSDGIFYHRESNTAHWFKKIDLPPISKNDLPYESRFVSNTVRIEYDANFNPIFDSKELNNLGDFLEENGITFGLEFETVKGYIPERICYKYGLIPLRDGSISGLEYVTIPLSGRKGIYAIREICKELTNRTKFDHTCALHLHLGGLDRTENSLLSMFLTSYFIQEESFMLQPAYKKGGMKIKGKNKDFCKELPFSSIFGSTNMKNIFESFTTNQLFSRLFSFISDGRSFSHYDNSLSKVKHHPSDPNGNRKWEIKSRYFWINMVPIVFGNMKTVEFRHHTPTTNLNKILNFIFMSASSIVFAKKFKREILDVNSDIIKYVNSNNNIYLFNKLFDKIKTQKIDNIIKQCNKYITIRKNIMYELTSSGDIAGLNERKFESNYSELDPNFWK